MMITFDYNPATNEYTPIKQEIIKESNKKKIVEVEETSEPQITLTSNKYILNTAAAELLGVKWEDRLDIKYQMIDGIRFPIIGSNSAWGDSSGNKLTKSLSVSYRGSANSMLAEYGEVFGLTAWKGHEGLFVLVGDTERLVSDENIEIVEEPSPEIDVEDPIEESTDIEEIIDAEENEDIYEINDFEFEL